MEETLTAAQAARYVEAEWGLRVDPRTVRRWVRIGAVAAVENQNGKVLVTPRALHRFLDDKTVMDDKQA